MIHSAINKNRSILLLRGAKWYHLAALTSLIVFLAFSFSGRLFGFIGISLKKAFRLFVSFLENLASQQSHLSQLRESLNCRRPFP